MSDMTPAPHAGSPVRHHDGEGSSWMIGVVLILLGLAFLLERAGVISMLGNWWSIFIYLAAFASLANAWRSYRAHEFGSNASGSLVWGLVLVVVASIFMFNLSWDMWWPAIVIAIGAGIVAGTLIGNSLRKPGGTG